MSKKTVRVAAVQLSAGANVAENLQTCLRMIDRAAAECQPDLMVLPEFCNHLSWYNDKQHCYDVSVPLDGEFLQAIAQKAVQYQCHIVINCTVQHPATSTATGTSLLYGPDGKLLVTSDKQVLMGHENDFLVRACALTPVVETSIGRISTYACMDGVINETPRFLALQGAQILCNSLNSFAIDEASLHVPVRAAENKVFVVAANKCGPLIPEFLLEPVSQATNIPIEFLHGAGESQIVSPDGTVLAKAPRSGEAVVWADIDPSQADNKRRPDGTDIFASRRPALYTAIAEQPSEIDHPIAATQLSTAVYQPRQDGISAIAEVANALPAIVADGVQVIVLPELFCFAGGIVADIKSAVERSTQAIHQLVNALAGSSAVVVTSLVDATPLGLSHVGVALGASGVLQRQAQLHRCERHDWVQDLGNSVNALQMEWGRLAILVGDDCLYPESFRLAVFTGVDVVAAPISVQEAWELGTGLLERSAENRVILLAASRPSPHGASLLTTLHKDFTLMTPWEKRSFDGYISYPLATFAPAEPGLTQLTVHPANTQNKVLSHRTDLVAGRPWYLAQPIVSESR
ncbi:MAG TPA: nitrilase-related carbon-nitrogen hydrolase [Anaerolineales bacterium]|nr:nitrilase-related carbon-nitrogen hydrolase [Anaerolineales bacterium]